MEYIGTTKKYGSTTTFTIDGVYTVEDYFNLRDVLKSDMARKKLAVFEDMNEFITAFNEIAHPPTTPLNNASLAWGVKIQDLIFVNGEYIMEYTINGIKSEHQEISRLNVFMFYTTKNLGTGKRKRPSRR